LKLKGSYLSFYAVDNTNRGIRFARVAFFNEAAYRSSISGE
jgi:hypothetical protein